jgi:hypothetical protein
VHGLATLLSNRESGFCQIPNDLIDEVCDTAVGVPLNGIKNPLVQTIERSKRPRTIQNPASLLIKIDQRWTHGLAG